MNWRSSLRFVTSVVAAVALVAGSAGCARVVDGRAVLASPRVGDPVQWDKCKFNADVDDAVKRIAQCGRIAVPALPRNRRACGVKGRVPTPVMSTR